MNWGIKQLIDGWLVSEYFGFLVWLRNQLKSRTSGALPLYKVIIFRWFSKVGIFFLVTSVLPIFGDLDRDCGGEQYQPAAICPIQSKVFASKVCHQMPELMCIKKRFYEWEEKRSLCSWFRGKLLLYISQMIVNVVPLVQWYCSFAIRSCSQQCTMCQDWL